MADTFAVWPDGTVCATDERRALAELLTWKSDDYEVKTAIGYDAGGDPIFADIPGKKSAFIPDHNSPSSPAPAGRDEVPPSPAISPNQLES